MLYRLLLVFCLSCLPVAHAAAPKAPKPLLVQLQRLTELLRDSHASWYADATLTQTLTSRSGEQLTLVVLTLEGFGGGNNHRQYLAAFSTEADHQGKPHYTLLDVIPIGGKGWRAVEQLKAQVSRSAPTGPLQITINALEVHGDDAPNFPSKPVLLRLQLHEGRLREMK